MPETSQGHAEHQQPQRQQTAETAASQHFAAYFGLWRNKVKVIFLATTNSCQREIKSAAFLFIREISWDTIFDVATAGKATKVQNEQLTLCAISRGFPPLMRIPFCAATPVPTITAVGVAKPKEQGHAMLSTVIEVWNANLSISSAFERCLFWFCKKREERRQKKEKKDLLIEDNIRMINHSHLKKHIYQETSTIGT